MNYWIAWPVGIALWLVLGWSAFAWFESRALRHDSRKDQITLSFWLYTIGSKFPLSIALACTLIGMFFCDSIHSRSLALLPSGLALGWLIGDYT